MQLNDLVGKSVKEMTPSELEERLNTLKSLKINMGKKTTSSQGEVKLRRPKSNKQKQAESIVNGLSPAELAKLNALLGG